MKNYVIVGASAGGISAAEAIRGLDSEGHIVLISDEAQAPYSRPRIGELLSGRVGSGTMLYRDPARLDELSMEVIQARATKLDYRNRQIHLNNGTTVAWDELLLATGGIPIVPPIEGLKDHRFHSFLTWRDAARLREELIDIKHALVVGGGLIGVGVSEALVQCGVQVTVVELAPQILGRALDDVAAGLVKRALSDKGVRVLTGTTVTKVLGPGQGKAPEGVLLTNGESFACDAVIMAIGVRPRLDLVQGTDIATNRGILVDDQMRTNLPGIYACGDVAEGKSLIDEGSSLAPVWPNACWGGRIAGANMAGHETKYCGCTGMNALHVFGLRVLSAGNVVSPADSGAETYTWQAKDGSAYRRVVVKDGLVDGLLVLGDIARAGLLFGLMQNRIEVGHLGEAIVDPDLGLLDFPASLRAAMVQQARYGA